MRLAREHARIFAVAGLLLATAGCASSGGAGGPEPAAGVSQTRALFERNCATCHGADGEGKQLGTMSIPSLRQGRPLTDTDEQLFRQLHDGGNGMPPFKYTLTDEQIQDLVSFVRKEIQKK